MRYISRWFLIVLRDLLVGWCPERGLPDGNITCCFRKTSQYGFTVQQGELCWTHPQSGQINPTTLLNEVSREGAFSCARDRHGDGAVASQPPAARHHPHARLSGATPLPIASGLARP